MTTYEQLKQEGEQIGLQKGLQMGRQAGRQEGLAMGARRVLIRLLSKRFHADAAQLEPLLSQLDPEQQDELSEKILEASSLEEIRAWLESVRQN